MPSRRLCAGRRNSGAKSKFYLDDMPLGGQGRRGTSSYAFIPRRAGAAVVCAGLAAFLALASPPAHAQRPEGGAIELAGRTVRCANVDVVMDRRLPSEGAAAPGVLILNPQHAQRAAGDRAALRVPPRMRPPPRRRQRAEGGLLGRGAGRARRLAQPARPQGGVRLLRGCAGDLFPPLRPAPLPQSRPMLCHRACRTAAADAYRRNARSLPRPPGIDGSSKARPRSRPCSPRAG